MSQILKLLAQSAIANQYADENRLRVFGLMRCVCTDNDPPTDKPRYIRVTTSSKGGKTQTPWLQPMRLIPGYDPPMPLIGSTVICACIDGDPHDMVWLGNVINDTNPEFEQQNPVADSSQLIPGHNTTRVGGDETNTVAGKRQTLVQGAYSTVSEKTEDRRVEEGLTISVGGSVIIENDAGARITLHESGAVIIESAFGNQLALGGASAGVIGLTSNFVMQTGGAAQWDMGGGSIDLTNVSEAKILGLSIATIGAIDSRGDSIVSRGW